MRRETDSLALLVTCITYLNTFCWIENPRGFSESIEYCCRNDLVSLLQSQRRRKQTLCECHRGSPVLCQKTSLMLCREYGARAENKWREASSIAYSAFQHGLHPCWDATTGNYLVSVNCRYATELPIYCNVKKKQKLVRCNGTTHARSKRT